MPLLATIPPPPGQAIELGPLTVHYYGIAIAVGVLVAISILRRRYAAAGGDAELADRVGLWATGIGFIGARLAYVLPRLDRFLPDDPLGILRVWEGGLALYGGLTFGTVALIVLVRRWGGDLPAFFDGVAPAVPVAQAFGRLGNYFNQELYGTPTTLPWALEVDPDRRVAQFAEFSTFHPTFAYEALWNLALAAALIWIGKRGVLRRGSLGFVYAMGYGAIRFLLEFIRTDQRAFEVILTANGWVSVVVFLIGLLGLLWWQRRPLPASAEEEVAHSEAGISEREAQPADEPAAEPVDGDPAEAPADEGLR